MSTARFPAALLPHTRSLMARRVISTDKAPQPIAPYSQAIEADGVLYVAGQVGLPPGGSALVDGGVVAEARQALANLRAIVEAAGATLRDVVRVGVYLTDMRDFPAVNAIYARYFPVDQEPPARSGVAVLALPLGAAIEFDAVVHMPR